MAKLAIIAGGPSIDSVPLDALQGGVLMAVNYAVRREDILPFVDIWFAQDPFHWFEPHIGESLRRIPTLRKDNSDMPRPLALRRPNGGDVEAAGLRGWLIGSCELEKSALDLFNAGLLTVGPALPSAIAAIMWASRRDFDAIELYGMDMTGTGSPVAPNKPYTEEGPEDMRWEQERRLLAALMERDPRIWRPS